MATGSELIRVEHIKKEYVGGTVKALNDCSISVARGEVVAIIGPSGSGKSTLLRCLNLLETPTSGKVIFGGVDITDTKVDLDLHRRKMGMVFQHFNLFPNMTVKRNITLAPVTLKLKTQAEADKLAMELLERIDLSDKADTYPAMLSGGQKQRLCIARALLKKPKILILDDSTSAVDTRTDALIRRGFREFIPETTKIIIAQRVASVQDADRIILMEGGCISAVGSHDELMQSSQVYREIYKTQNREGDKENA